MTEEASSSEPPYVPFYKRPLGVLALGVVACAFGLYFLHDAMLERASVAAREGRWDRLRIQEEHPQWPKPVLFVEPVATDGLALLATAEALLPSASVEGPPEYFRLKPFGTARLLDQSRKCPSQALDDAAAAVASVWGWTVAATFRDTLLRLMSLAPTSQSHSRP